MSDQTPTGNEKPSTIPTTDENKKQEIPDEPGSKTDQLPEATPSPSQPDQPVTQSEIVTSPPPITPTTPASAPPIASSSTLAAPTPLSQPSPSPAKRRPKPPTKGILKPPPPPAKPTLGNRLRDIVGGAVNTAVGTTSRLFDANEEIPNGTSAGPSTSSSSGSDKGPSSANLQTTSSAPGGTLASISGRLAGLGLSRFVPSPTALQGREGSPIPSRSISLPETGSPMMIHGQGGNVMLSEKSRQKQPLKRATFVLPSLSITYPISSQGEPWSAKVIEDRKRIESNHRSLLSSSCGPQYWTSQRLVTLYESACRGREERPRVGIVRALETIPPPPKIRHIHLTLRPIDHTTIGNTLPPGSPNTLDTPFTRYSAESFADVLSAEWGLMELKLESGLIETEDSLKPILHALLISGTLPNLSLAGNKKIKVGGWRLLAVFLKRARSLRYIDLSDTTWDKKGIEYLVQALTPTQIKAAPDPGVSPDPSSQHEPQQLSHSDTDQPNDIQNVLIDAYGSFIPPAPLLKENDQSSTPAAVQTLRLDGCGLRANVMETLAQGVRNSDLKNISLRRNRIGPLGAVALALMIRDYPDSALTMSSLSPGLSSSSATQSPLLLPADATPSTPTPLPYSARIRKPQPALPDDERDLPPIPLVVSSATGGITSRTVPEGYKPPPPPKNPLVMPSGGNSVMQDAGNFTGPDGKTSSAELGGASMALQRSVRALDGVERIGRLLTLDLKSNEIKNGVTYIAQVLKRNRTLKVLNLSDNRIEPSGLVALAEALKYNSTLETLDLSSNPCCGPTLEGIASLRTTFTVNTSLKRLFLSDTGLTTEGAISLAEFLPESKSLLHLDLTENPLIETAGILAISVGLKSNKLIRCLDLSVKSNNNDLAELSQNILQLCIRNTEIAAESIDTSAKAKGQKHKQGVIWEPIKKSTLVKQIKELDELEKERKRLEIMQSPQGQAREYVYTLKPQRILGITEEVVRDLYKWFSAAQVYNSARNRNGWAWEPDQLPGEEYAVLYERAKALKERVIEQIQEPSINPEGVDLERLLALNDELETIVRDGRNFNPPPRLLLPSQIIPTYEQSPSSLPQRSNSTSSPANRLYPNHQHPRRHMRISSTEISSPNFSIGDSDNDSDPEEIDEKSFTSNNATPTKSTTSSSNRNLTPNRLNNNSGLGFGSVDHTVPSTKPDEVEEGLLEKQENEASPSTGLLPVNQQGEGDAEDFLNDLTSPTEKASRAWVEEEGEIFRKGHQLGVGVDVDDEEDEGRTGGMGLGEEMEGVSGEELRKEILETPVARNAARRVIPVEEGDGEGVGELDEGEGEGEERKEVN
ncbi:hypothetical protein I302_105515 [Kwoniella bestiolae CBS 10118]|uniref:RNI-like protein n=1 Tax=Kwoniella bestiolae CBS 10118 TaxID=1296100 RepID=A0A1B9FTB8_9TREE|nr:hypothetical protein I302_08796 [Kwoniella bestiolae CBS 10118]OCF22015.1 hypothetical protein I302_08796 [Kwoniella bestiolae CBS 10118]